MTSRIQLTLLVIVLCMITHCSSRSADIWFSETVDPDGVRVVQNGSKPQESSEKLPQLGLHEEVRIGADTGPEEYLLSFQPSGRWLATGPDEQIAFTERRPAELRVYDSSGRFLRGIGREGDGPGEFRMPVDPAFVTGVGWIINDPMNMRLSIFTESGDFVDIKSLGLLPFGQFIRTMEFSPDGDFWFLGTRLFQRDENRYNGFHLMWTDWNRFEAVEVDTFEQLMMSPRGRDSDIYMGFPLNLETDQFGRAWMNTELAYQIDVYEPEGGEHWRIRREYELIDYPADVRTYQESLTMMESPEQTWYTKLPPMQPAIAGLKWIETGEMWVFTSTYIDSPLVQVDVFTPEGRYVRAFLADKRLKDMEIGADHLYKSDTTENGSPVLIRCSYYIEP